MRVVALVLLLLAAAGSPAAQEKSRWRRVYTFEDAYVEMEVRRIWLSSDGYGRVRFRTVFDEAGPMGRLGGVSYRSSVEDVEIECSERAYRVAEVLLLDAGGRVVRTLQASRSAEWRVAGRGSVMGRQLDAACRMFAEKKL